MQLSSLHLKAFYEVTKTLSFSAAAKKLYITQSALSQRVLNLEKELELTLFIRDSSGLKLTEAGQKLLHYCQTNADLESELLADLTGKNKDGLGGALVIGGLSSIIWSIAVPQLKKIITSNPHIHFDFKSSEERDLHGLLKTGAIQYALVNKKIQKPEIIQHLLGYEENVLVHSSKEPPKVKRLIDHDEHDQTGPQFFALQKKSFAFKRVFMDDIHGLLAGVKSSYGYAVLPKHLLRKEKGITIVKGQNPLMVPIYLAYFKQPYYSQLHREVVDCFVSKAIKN